MVYDYPKYTEAIICDQRSWKAKNGLLIRPIQKRREGRSAFHHQRIAITLSTETLIIVQWLGTFQRKRRYFLFKVQSLAYFGTVTTLCPIICAVQSVIRFGFAKAGCQYLAMPSQEQMRQWIKGNAMDDENCNRLVLLYISQEASMCYAQGFDQKE